MKSAFDGSNWLIRLEKGELLVESLTKFVRKKKIKGGWISGTGGAQWVTLGFYDLATKHYNWKKIDTKLEITSLQGNISWVDVDPFLHIHGTFSDKDMNVKGGHIKELAVGGTCEVLIHLWDKDQLTRSLDKETGLGLLDL